MTNEETTQDASGRAYSVTFDGSCLGNPGAGGYAAILVSELTQKEKIVKDGVREVTTNNRMELMAAIKALEFLKAGSFVTMQGDSKYVVESFTKWLPNWKANGWRGSDRKPVKNQDLWEALDAAVARHAEVRWKWVEGHSGHTLNDRVDKLAKEQARRANARGLTISEWGETD